MVHKPKATREGLNAEIMRLIKWAYLVLLQRPGRPGRRSGRKNQRADAALRRRLVITGYQPEIILAR